MGNGSKGDMDGDQRFGELRASRRMRTLKEGKLAFHDQFCTVDVIVRDLSENGAKLVVKSPPHSLDDLVLHIPMDGFMVSCERIWQNGEFWGVHFTGSRMATRIARSQILKDSQQEVRTFRPRAPEVRKEESEPVAPQRPVFGKRS